MPLAALARLRPRAWLARRALAAPAVADLADRDPEGLEDLRDHGRILFARQRAQGRLRWHVLYLLSRTFRWEEEKAAWYAVLARRLRRGLRPSAADLDDLACALTGGGVLGLGGRGKIHAFLAAALSDLEGAARATPAGSPGGRAAR